jgi:L-fucose isomerase-like protein
VSLTLTGARVRRAKIGLIGTHAPGFLNMQMDPALVRRQLGIVAHHVAVQEFIDAVQAVDAAAVAADRRELDALKLPVADDVPDEALDLTSRYTLALRELMDSEHLDALALRCWPELPNVLGVWPYVAMARLFEEGRAIAMEGDFDGALTLLLGKWMDYGPSYLSDWLEHDEHTLTLWHQGEAPLSLCESGSAALGRHFNNDKPGVLNAQLAADRKITLARVWRCDGAYRMTAVDARTAAPRRRLKGTVGLAVFEALDVREWFDDLCHEGMPHHLALFTGHRTDELRRLARLLDVTWIAAAPKNDACPKLVAER